MTMMASTSSNTPELFLYQAFPTRQQAFRHLQSYGEQRGLVLWEGTSARRLTRTCPGTQEPKGSCQVEQCTFRIQVDLVEQTQLHGQEQQQQQDLAGHTAEWIVTVAQLQHCNEEELNLLQRVGAGSPSDSESTSSSNPKRTASSASRLTPPLAPPLPEATTEAGTQECLSEECPPRSGVKQEDDAVSIGSISPHLIHPAPIYPSDTLITPQITPHNERLSSGYPGTVHDADLNMDDGIGEAGVPCDPRFYLACDGRGSDGDLSETETELSEDTLVVSNSEAELELENERSYTSIEIDWLLDSLKDASDILQQSFPLPSILQPRSPTTEGNFGPDLSTETMMESTQVHDHASPDVHHDLSFHDEFDYTLIDIDCGPDEVGLPDGEDASDLTAAFDAAQGALGKDMDLSGPSDASGLGRLFPYTNPHEHLASRPREESSPLSSLPDTESESEQEPSPPPPPPSRPVPRRSAARTTAVKRKRRDTVDWISPVRRSTRKRVKRDDASPDPEKSTPEIDLSTPLDLSPKPGTFPACHSPSPTSCTSRSSSSPEPIEEPSKESLRRPGRGILRLSVSLKESLRRAKHSSLGQRSPSIVQKSTPSSTRSRSHTLDADGYDEDGVYMSGLRDENEGEESEDEGPTVGSVAVPKSHCPSSSEYEDNGGPSEMDSDDDGEVGSGCRIQDAADLLKADDSGYQPSSGGQSEGVRSALDEIYQEEDDEAVMTMIRTVLATSHTDPVQPTPNVRPRQEQEYENTDMAALHEELFGPEPEEDSESSEDEETNVQEMLLPRQTESEVSVGDGQARGDDKEKDGQRARQDSADHPPVLLFDNRELLELYQALSGQPSLLRAPSSTGSNDDTSLSPLQTPPEPDSAVSIGHAGKVPHPASSSSDGVGGVGERQQKDGVGGSATGLTKGFEHETAYNFGRARRASATPARSDTEDQVEDSDGTGSSSSTTSSRSSFHSRPSLTVTEDTPPPPPLPPHGGDHPIHSGSLAVVQPMEPKSGSAESQGYSEVTTPSNDPNGLASRLVRPGPPHRERSDEQLFGE